MELLRLAQKAGVWRSPFYNLKEVKTQATLASVSRAMLPVNQTHAHRVDTAAARANIFENFGPCSWKFDSSACQVLQSYLGIIKT